MANFFLFYLDMLDLESKFELLEGEVKEINANKETLKKNLLDLTELQHILYKTQSFFHEVILPLHYTIRLCVRSCDCPVCRPHLVHCVLQGELNRGTLYTQGR